jgi:hypothetical protein
VETFVSICLGVALSAACGLRVFVPALFVSVAARTGRVTLSPGFDWMAGTPALVTFAAATVPVPILAFLLFLGTALFLASRLLRKA